MKLQNWTPLKIKHTLEENGHTQADVAVALKISATQVYRVVWQNQVSDRVRRKIAEFCGVEVSVIWPEYYLKKMIAYG